MSVEIPRCQKYNGTVLPRYPADLDTAKYSNILILDSSTVEDEQAYVLWACSKPLTKYSDNSYAFTGPAEIIGYSADKKTCSWIQGNPIGDTSVATLWVFTGTYVWSFLPIYEHSDTTVVAHGAGTLEDWDAEEPNITVTGAGTAENPTGYWQGDTATTLTCEASVSDGGELSYKWYKNGSTLVSTERSYTPSTNNVGQFVYYCVVTNTLTGESGFSDIDTATSESVVIVVTAKEEEPDIPDIPDIPDTPVVVEKRKPTEIIGYVLRMCGVPCAEAIAMMIAGMKAKVSAIQENSVLYILDAEGTVNGATLEVK